MSKAKFITIEGTEGVGKSTQNKAIQGWLIKQGIDFFVTREPGGTVISEKIRKLLLDKKSKAMCAYTELLLIFAARYQHLHEKILPALDNNIWVLCDRFVDSSYAYQGFGRELDIEKIKKLEQWTLGDLKPDKTFLLQMSINEGLRRASTRSELDRFEQEKVSFHKKVEKGYSYRASNDSERFSVINANQSIEKVTCDIIKELEKLIYE